MRKKTKTPTLQNKNGPITITPGRTKKDPITFRGSVSGRFGPVEIILITSAPGWERLRRNAWVPKEFGDAFSNDVIAPVYHDKIRDRPAKDEWLHMTHRNKRLLTALLFLYYSGDIQRKLNPLTATIKTIDSLYSDIKKSSLKSFENNYLRKGNDILDGISDNVSKKQVLLDLDFEYEKRINEMEASKKKNNKIILAYNVISAAVAIVFQPVKNEFSHPEYFDESFKKIYTALKLKK